MGLPTEPLVLVPGMYSDAQVFGPQIAALGIDHVLVLPPLPVQDSARKMALDLLGQLPSHFALAGQGLGGWVAIELLREAPNRVTRLALLATDPLPEPPRIAAAREPKVAKARAGALADVLDDDLNPVRFADLPGRRAQVGLLRDSALRAGPLAYVAQTRATQRRPDQQAVLHRITVPTLVIAGEDDPFVPVRRQTLMADLLPWSELLVLPEAGHLPSLDQPEKVSAALRFWMRIELPKRM